MVFLSFPGAYQVSKRQLHLRTLRRVHWRSPGIFFEIPLVLFQIDLTCMCVRFQTFTEDKIFALGEICMDEDVARAVHKAAQSSMGMDCSVIDMVNIMAFTQRMVKLAEYRLQVLVYPKKE
jgi:hypothetical protein